MLDALISRVLTLMDAVHAFALMFGVYILVVSAVLFVVYWLYRNK
jgi:hypothetical protein